jgi:hypothetical protein
MSALRASRGQERPQGVSLKLIQRQLGHADLGVTSVYLQGIDSTEVISTVRSRLAPTMPASAGLMMCASSPRLSLFGTPVAIVVSLLGALSR